MKQKIYDIPLWDAFNLENCECPLCSIEKKIEADFIETIYEEMVMDVRLNPQLVEEYRFCREHFEKLYKYPDKFGLAILTDRIFYLEKQALQELKKSTTSSPKKALSFFKKNTPNPLLGEEKPCLICTKIEQDMDNYINTMISLWIKEDKFKELYKNSRGFCIHHFKKVLTNSEKSISNSKTLMNFKEETLNLQENNLNRLHEELEWFITKFDYRFKDEPWKTSKDALIRTILKITGNYNKE